MVALLGGLFPPYGAMAIAASPKLLDRAHLAIAPAQSSGRRAWLRESERWLVHDQVHVRAKGTALG